MIPVVEMRGISKTYPGPRQPIPVLGHLDLTLFGGEFIGIMGTSGSGKSTLLNLIGCLDRPSGGTYHLNGVDTRNASDDQLSRLRSRSLGFVFQTFHLIEGMTVAENVGLPFLYQDLGSKIVRLRVAMAIEQVGLRERASHRPAELSGGEMQRVAIARALAVEPRVILADEPTGNLDARTGKEIMALINTLHDQGRTIVLVTHDAAVAAYADRRVVLSDGRLCDDLS